MNKWVEPEITELTVSATQHDWVGSGDDGGTYTDGVISGHLIENLNS